MHIAQFGFKLARIGAIFYPRYCHHAIFLPLRHRDVRHLFQFRQWREKNDARAQHWIYRTYKLKQITNKTKKDKQHMRKSK